MVCITLDAAVRYRFTRVNTCCAPLPGDMSQTVTEALSTLEFTANTEDVGREALRNTAGNVCIPGNQRTELTNYTVNMTFCSVQPCLYEMITGRRPVLDYAGNPAGFRIGTGRTDLGGFALEVWFSEVSGGPCDPTTEGRWLYMVVPCLTPATIGDFSAEDGTSITFPLTANTKDGAAWCRGPYDVVPQDDANTPGPLIDPLEQGDHIYSMLTTIPPPDDSGCVCGPLAYDDLGCESPAESPVEFAA